jgi:hypothetical protein
MPLAFDSLSHGSIAFGFFNIESDMLLCDRYFLFADEFCSYVEDIAKTVGEQTYRTIWQVQIIQTAEAIGDLMGAIHGIRYTGFIGELYRCFPFPPGAQDFKQNPQGFQTQSQVSEIIANYAEPLEIHVTVDNVRAEIQIGDYRFSRAQFQELIDYVWRGGYPHWKDEIRPAYVSAMRDKILRNCQGIFEGVTISTLSY